MERLAAIMKALVQCEECNAETLHWIKTSTFYPNLPQQEITQSKICDVCGCFNDNNDTISKLSAITLLRTY